MKKMLSLALGCLLGVAGCAGRTDFVPQGGPVTVGMPAKLSERERGYIGQVEGALRGAGYMPVRHGKGEMALDFTMEQGPINTDTTISLFQNERLVAEGRGRKGGVPLIGRNRVADESFQQAFSSFQASLPPGGASTDFPAGGSDPLGYGY